MRKKMTAIVLAVLAFSMIAASAASLGGITTADLGAETDVVASCDSNGVNADFSVAFSGGEYRITAVDISGADLACETLPISVTLLDVAGNSLGSASGTVAAGGDFSGNVDASAEAVEGIAVVIEG